MLRQDSLKVAEARVSSLDLLSVEAHSCCIDWTPLLASSNFDVTSWAKQSSDDSRRSEIVETCIG